MAANVRGGALHQLRVVPQMADGDVAGPAQQFANGAGCMVVVDGQPAPSGRGNATAQRASSFLPGYHAFVLLAGNTENSLAPSGEDSLAVLLVPAASGGGQSLAVLVGPRLLPSVLPRQSLGVLALTGGATATMPSRIIQMLRAPLALVLPYPFRVLRTAVPHSLTRRRGCFGRIHTPVDYRRLPRDGEVEDI